LAGGTGNVRGSVTYPTEEERYTEAFADAMIARGLGSATVE